MKTMVKKNPRTQLILSILLGPFGVFYSSAGFGILAVILFFFLMIFGLFGAFSGIDPLRLMFIFFIISYWVIPILFGKSQVQRWNQGVDTMLKSSKE